VVHGSNPSGTRFSTPVQAGSEAHPAFYIMGYWVSFLGVKQLGCDIDHPPSSSNKVKERSTLYLYSLSGPSWPVVG